MLKHRIIIDVDLATGQMAISGSLPMDHGARMAWDYITAELRRLLDRQFDNTMNEAERRRVVPVTSLDLVPGGKAQ